MTEKEQAQAIGAAVLPLVLWLVLGVVNVRFIGRMFADSSAQPLGWIMSAAVLLLAGAAYVLQRKAFEISAQADRSSHGAKRGRTRTTLRVASIVLCVLPAILLVVFGPAIMTILEAGL